VLVELMEWTGEPAASLLQEPRLQRELRAQPQWPRAGDALLARLPRRLVLASPLEQELQVQCRDADE
jgi:hypothetical protein